MIDQLRRKRFTRSEVQRMMDSGLFDGQRYELIEGDLIDKMGQHPPHAFGIRFVTAWLLSLFGSLRVQTQLPIEIAREDEERSMPEPDIAVLAEYKPEYEARHPRGDEVLLIVEIADSSVQLDLRVKARLYARAGVPEYWVLDVQNRWLVIHRHLVEGVYRQVTQLAEQEMATIDGGSILISKLLPTRT